MEGTQGIQLSRMSVSKYTHTICIHSDIMSALSKLQHSTRSVVRRGRNMTERDERAVFYSPPRVPVDCSWTAHGLLMDCSGTSWSAHGLLMDCSWSAHGVHEHSDMFGTIYLVGV